MGTLNTVANSSPANMSEVQRTDKSFPKRTATKSVDDNSGLNAGI
jgi:hypothetical protein